MTKQHRATPEQWADQKRWADEDADSFCIIELCARIEALEATQHAHVDTSHLTDAKRKQICEELARPATFAELLMPPPRTTTPVPLFTAEEVAPVVVPTVKESLTDPAGSLLDQVAQAIYEAPNTHEGWRSEARAAILEVAAWLTENYARDVASPPPCQMLRNEVNR
jgi:hypothetical protein